MINNKESMLWHFVRIKRVQDLHVMVDWFGVIVAEPSAVKIRPIVVQMLFRSPILVIHHVGSVGNTSGRMFKGL